MFPTTDFRRRAAEKTFQYLMITIGVIGKLMDSAIRTAFQLHAPMGG